MPSEPRPTDTDTEPQPQQKTSTDAKKKVANSYYYWHGHEKERAKVGDVAPMPTPQLVKKSESVDPISIAATTVSITKYSWSDAEKVATVYVETKVEGEQPLVDETLQVEFQRRKVTVSYVANVESSKATTLRRKKQLLLHLCKAIKADESTYKVKESSGQIVLRLVKEKPSTWFELVGKDAALGSDSDKDSEAGDGGRGLVQDDGLE
ncbi:hypothetical protein TRSC58_04160 [Trypanosoma rangeli SC58]|uniref:CS domain-containing protein n=1 Tax=Trypanosoma rangeli SC58 TaxID=429131 RepID=A0A061J4C7_TRYRA|nr:hypothetical protein TRSC58_04160 [Trypanosoma rangeli SC58]